MVLSAYSRNSLQFVTLDETLLIDPAFDYVDSIGMDRLQVCYNETVVGRNCCQVIDLFPEIVEAASILFALGLWFRIFIATFLSTALYWECIKLRPICFGLLFVGLNVCQFIDLSPEIVNDSQFEAARILLTLGLWFGIFFVTVLSTVIYWESIKVRPISFGLLFVGLNFFQFIDCPQKL